MTIVAAGETNCPAKAARMVNSTPHSRYTFKRNAPHSCSSAELIIQKMYQKNAKNSALIAELATFGGEITNEKTRQNSPPSTAFGISGRVPKEIWPPMIKA